MTQPPEITYKNSKSISVIKNAFLEESDALKTKFYFARKALCRVR
jgi:hypothetical protein